MIENEALAKSFSGNYSGWARDPGTREWEDMLGQVKVGFSVNEAGGLEITISSIEFGEWTGTLHPREPVIQGLTGQGDTYFMLKHQHVGIRDGFMGGIYQPPGEQVVEIQLNR